MTRNGGRFLTTKHTKHTKGGVRGPETLPANYAEGREWRKGDSEEWPTEHTEHTEDTEGGGREPEKLPANGAKGRERGRGHSEEWPTEHTEYTERGARGGNRGNGRRRSLFNHEIHGIHGNWEGGGRGPETEGGKLA